MKVYFLLQYTLTNRKLRDLGINPIIGYLLGAIGFVVVSEYIFYRTEFATYIVMLVAFGFLANASEARRSDFLKIVFGAQKSREIRMVENAGMCIPFSLLLIFHNAYIESTLLLTGSILLAWGSFKNKFTYSMPTPFYNRPFEFAAGFRNTFYLIISAYGLTAIAVSVDNFNLGIFALLVIFLISLTYYVKPEYEYYVWVNSKTPSAFIFDKLKTAGIYAAFLVIPIVVALVLLYSQNSHIILICSLLGFAFLSMIILAKYSVYPQEMNFPEGVLIAVCILFPPLLLAVIPFFYTKAIKKLNLLLE